MRSVLGTRWSVKHRPRFVEFSVSKRATSIQTGDPVLWVMCSTGTGWACGALGAERSHLIQTGGQEASRQGRTGGCKEFRMGAR